MSRANVDRLRRIQQRLFDCRRLGPEVLAEGVEWVNPRDAVEPGRRRGVDGFNEAIASVFDAWQDARFDIERFLDSGDDVVALGQVHGRGHTAGIEVDRPHAQIWTFRDGRVIRMRWFHSHREALEAVGRPEKAMSQDKVEVVRGIYAEWGRGNFRAGTDLFDQHVVLVLRDEFPDSGTYIGRDEIRTYMRHFLADWTGARIEAEDIFSRGDTVVAAVHQQATGTGSGLSVDMRYWQVWTFRGNSITRIESIKTRPEALEAVGLSE
jgi:uncharacterized protein